MNTPTDVLKEATKDILSPESLTAIEKTFNEQVETKVALHVEKALNEQDADYTSKLQKLLEAIDADHTKKLNKVYNAVCENHAAKLQGIVNKYEAALNTEAVGFKNTLVENLSKYIDLYIDEKIPAAAINEAVKNKRAVSVLNGLREALAVDSVVSNSSVKEAVIDAKGQINEATQKLDTVLSENAALKSQLDKLNTNTFLTAKTEGMEESKKSALIKILGNKPYEFVKENFEYTSKMFEKTEAERIEAITQEATATTEAEKVDRPVVEESVITEQAENDSSAKFYLGELSKY
jgi:hypothetical protein